MFFIQYNNQLCNIFSIMRHYQQTDVRCVHMIFLKDNKFSRKIILTFFFENAEVLTEKSKKILITYQGRVTVNS